MSVRLLGRGVLWVSVAFLLAGNLIWGAWKHKDTSTVKDDRQLAYESMALYTKVLEEIREHYVDEDKVSYEDLVRSSLEGLLPSLDAHSQFLDQTMYRDMRNDTAGRFGGIGVVISMKNDMLTVVSPMEDSPGFRAGILSGDRIIEIAGKPTKGVDLNEAVKHLRGEIGTPVTMKLLRPSTTKVSEVTLVREIIKVASVKDARLMEGTIGYVRITQFNQPTAEALQDALSQLFDQGMESLILDLRDNPGGLLSSAIDVTQKFIPRKSLVVFTQGRHPDDRRTYEARGIHHYLDLPIAILVNDGSASASEIVAGALQDHQRAILIGERTFGKGSVQSILPLADESALRLTTAKYYTPSERVIHENGIEPDIVVPMSPENWRKILLKRSRLGDYVPEEGEEDYRNVEDPQLDRAIDVLTGIKVFQSRLTPARKSHIAVSAR
jgi:carboxyl-terminal processing protease